MRAGSHGDGGGGGDNEKQIRLFEHDDPLQRIIALETRLGRFTYLVLSVGTASQTASKTDIVRKEFY
jgi:hypothetical protein